MRKGLLFLLLATAAQPAMAADDDDGGRTSRREAARAERAERAVARAESQSEAPENRARVARPAELPSPEPRAIERGGGDRAVMREERREAVVERVERRSPRLIAVEPDRPAVQRDDAVAEPRVQRRGPRMVEVGATLPTLETPAVDTVRPRRRLEREGVVRPAVIELPAEAGVQPLVQRRPRRTEPLERLGGLRTPAISRVPREGTQPPPLAEVRPTRLTRHQWRGDWRSDRRYDWRDHRRRHRSLFRFAIYLDPFGWSYRPYSIGWRLWPNYYRSSRYWLRDAWTYRLPYAPPGYRWIRYYDDALLVDTWDGQVVDVIRDFFW